MGAAAAQIQALHRHAVIAVAQHRAGGPKLIKADAAMDMEDAERDVSVRKKRLLDNAREVMHLEGRILVRHFATFHSMDSASRLTRLAFDVAQLSSLCRVGPACGCVLRHVQICYLLYVKGEGWRL